MNWSIQKVCSLLFLSFCGIFSLELRLIAENSLMTLFSTSTTKLNLPHFDVWKAAKWKEHIVSYDASLGSVVNVGDFFWWRIFFTFTWNKSYFDMQVVARNSMILSSELQLTMYTQASICILFILFPIHFPSPQVKENFFNNQKFF